MAPDARPAPPTPWEVAERLYNGIFGVTSHGSRAVAAASWAAFSEAERDFIRTHLAYLTLGTLHSLRRGQGRDHAIAKQLLSAALDGVDLLAELVESDTDAPAVDPEEPDSEERDAPAVTRASRAHLQTAAEQLVEGPDVDPGEMARRAALAEVMAGSGARPAPAPVVDAPAKPKRERSGKKRPPQDTPQETP